MHVYSIDTSKAFGEHILSSGTASPGALSNQNFSFANGTLAFLNHPPVADAGPDQTVVAAADGNASVTLDGSHSSDPDGDALTFTWSGPFGQVNGAQPLVTLAVGEHVVTLVVNDSNGGSSTATTMVTVNAKANTDTTPPVLSVPTGLTVEATTSAGAVVAFSATAVDAVDGSRPVNCAPISGATFALGTTIVSCNASDLSGNTANASFTITVRDTTPAGYDLAWRSHVRGDKPGGRRGGRSARPRTTASRGREQSLACRSRDRRSRSGPTPVACSSTDAHGNTASGTFGVTVRDTTPPTIDPHADVTVNAASASGAVVTYSPPATHDLVDGTRDGGLHAGLGQRVRRRADAGHVQGRGRRPQRRDADDVQRLRPAADTAGRTLRRVQQGPDLVAHGRDGRNGRCRSE